MVKTKDSGTYYADSPAHSVHGICCKHVAENIACVINFLICICIYCIVHRQEFTIEFQEKHSLWLGVNMFSSWWK